MVSNKQSLESVESATVRFAGDSGDGMQLAGMRFTDTSAIVGNDVATFPDFPAEIRAPAGTVAGVSGFQVNFASEDIYTPGDEVDALIAMNPAAFKANVTDVRGGGIVIVNESEFTKINLRKAGYPEGYNPLDDDEFDQKFKLYKVPITRLTTESLSESPLGAKDIGRCKNMYALGLIYFLYDRPLDTTTRYLEDYFGKKKSLPDVAAANVRALRAGFDFGDTAEMFPVRYHVAKAPIEAGVYRRITGNEALAMGLIAAGELSDKSVIYCTYPITPASDILHYLAAMRHFGVKTFQAEDEIAAVCAAIGASYTGQLGVTGTSGPGLCLKAEAVGLATIMELPLVIVNVQRGGPSTGLPTKTEQSDLLQAMYGRNGDSSVIVIAPLSPSDCFDTAIEASRLALETMTPVIILSDGYIANGAEPWKLPDPDTFEKITITHPDDAESYRPYSRDKNLARPWAIPGQKDMQHRVGGLEKEHGTGNVSYDPENHQLMTELRAAKIERLADRLPPAEVDGPDEGDLLMVGWGGTYGAITTAATELREQGRSVAHLHIRHLNPLPRNLGEILKRYKRVLIPELNTGQLRQLLRAKFLVDARGINKIQGKPFLIEELMQAATMMLDGHWPDDAESLKPHHHGVALDAQDIDQYLETASS